MRAIMSNICINNMWLKNLISKCWHKSSLMKILNVPLMQKVIFKLLNYWDKNQVFSLEKVWHWPPGGCWRSHQWQDAIGDFPHAAPNEIFRCSEHHRQLSLWRMSPNLKVQKGKNHQKPSTELTMYQLNIVYRNTHVCSANWNYILRLV